MPDRVRTTVCSRPNDEAIPSVQSAGGIDAGDDSNDVLELSPRWGIVSDMTSFSRTRPAGEAPPAALVRMRIVATGLLVLMAATFFVSRALVPVYPAFAFVRAFAEAAMVGGLADWFAVTALFRHPLGLPIPHTAIVPRNKDRIGDTLAQFLRDNFLIPVVVARRTRRLDVAAAIARWLTDPPEGAGGRFRQGASRLVAQVLEGLDPARLGGMVKAGIGNRLRQTEVSPILGQLLKAAIAERRHAPLLESAIRWAAKTLAANDHLVRAMVHDKAGSILRWTGLDETVANKLIGGFDRLLAEMAEDPEHPLRLKAEEGLDRLAWDLQYDRRMRERVEALKNELLDNPAMQRWRAARCWRSRATRSGRWRESSATCCGSLARHCSMIRGCRGRSTGSSAAPRWAPLPIMATGSSSSCPRRCAVGMPTRSRGGWRMRSGAICNISASTGRSSVGSSDW